ncbi:MAG: hypothetical protein EA426_08560 [Spirochaetaceae bacterium]|nr:MAG: hypothetical protein EA426_08560 [Spirochaetaceae bacterium]
MFTGCGIETLPYLEAPTIAGSQPFPNLQHSTLNAIDEFVGYDFYYRFFSDSEAFQPNAVNTNLAGESSLLSRGYRRMLTRVKTDDGTPGSVLLTPPALRIPDALRNTQLSFEIELPDGILLAEPQIIPPSEHAAQLDALYLMRNVGTPASPEALSFLEPFSAADQNDLSAAGISNAASIDQITIAIYAIAVGYDLTSFAPIRSVPVFGGLTTFIPN